MHSPRTLETMTTCRTFLMVGVCGSYTAFSLPTLDLLRTDQCSNAVRHLGLARIEGQPGAV